MENKPILLYNKATTGKKSQAACVYSVNGICFTLCAGTHGYAMGYILEENDGKDKDIHDERWLQVEQFRDVT